MAPPAVSKASTSSRLTSASPTEDLLFYWTAVSNGQYTVAWDRLSPGFKAITHGNDYGDYEQGYQKMNVCSVQVKDVRLVEQTGNRATVSGHYTYRTGSACTVSTHTLVFELVYDASRDAWLINRSVK